jgi:O-antigen ligase
VLSFVALGLSFLQVMLSGRRAFVLIGVLGPLIVYVLFMVSGLKNPFNLRKIAIVGFACLIVLVILFSYSELSWEVMLDDFMSGFDFTDNANRRSSSVRGDQFQLLGQGWLDAFLFGHGHGSFHPGVVSDDTAPWSYELSYVALLFQLGIVGFGVYLLALVWLGFRAISLIRFQHRHAAVLLPLLAGLLGFLIANATNPYLSKFDYLWTIFLLVGAVNCFEIEGSAMMNSGRSFDNAI